MKLYEITELGNYIIKEVSEPSNKLSGLGIIKNTKIEIIRITKHLITFKLSMTEIFCRKDLKIEVTKNEQP